jgi:AcrR family transcriptional regulator
MSRGKVVAHVATAEELPSRRERLRAETTREIRATARRVLVEQGVEGLALRAIARDMGLSAPALYRYYASREDLLDHVVADLYEELIAALEGARDAVEPADPCLQLMAASREFRSWATTHHAEFGLLFGSPAEQVRLGRPDEPRSPAQQGAQRFGLVFGSLIARIYLERGFPIPADDEIDPVLQEQLRGWGDTVPVELPLGVLQVFLSCWIRLYGMVCMEVFGHLRFALDDAEALFESELRGLARLLGFGPDAGA